MRFTNVFPEAMPTVPARNAILSGRRQFPFRGWYDRRGLIEAPGWEPFDHVDASFLSVLRRAGWWTAYVTDNPFLGYAPPYGRFRGSVNRFVRTGGQIGGHQPVSSVPDKVLRHWLHPANDDAKRRAAGSVSTWPTADPGRAPTTPSPARVFRNAIDELNQRGRAARPVRARGGHLRAARAVDAAARASSTSTASWRRARAGDAAATAARRAGSARGERGPVLAPDARPLRRRGDDDRPLARHAHRPPPRARPRARDRDRAGGRPRHPARRARLDRARSRPRSTRRSSACR